MTGFGINLGLAVGDSWWEFRRKVRAVGTDLGKKKKKGKSDVTKAKKRVFLKGSRGQTSDVIEGGVSRGQRWA